MDQIEVFASQLYLRRITLIETTMRRLYSQKRRELGAIGVHCFASSLRRIAYLRCREVPIGFGVGGSRGSRSMSELRFLCLAAIRRFSPQAQGSGFWWRVQPFCLLFGPVTKHLQVISAKLGKISSINLWPGHFRSRFPIF